MTEGLPLGVRVLGLAWQITSHSKTTHCSLLEIRAGGSVGCRIKAWGKGEGLPEEAKEHRLDCEEWRFQRREEYVTPGMGGTDPRVQPLLMAFNDHMHPVVRARNLGVSLGSCPPAYPVPTLRVKSPTSS